MDVLLKGEGIILSVWDGTAYRPVACLTANSLAQTRNIIETQTKCDPGVTRKGAGAMNYSISAEGIYIDTTSAGSASSSKASHDWLKPKMDSGENLVWRMATLLTDNEFYYGNSIMQDLNLDAPAGDEFATFSATLSGDGAIVTTDPNA